MQHSEIMPTTIKKAKTLVKLKKAKEYAKKF